MKVVIFILALVVGASSLMMVKQFKPDRPPVTPVLVANIGMPIDDVRKRSTPGVVGDGVYFARRNDGSSEDQYRADTRDRAFYREEPFDWEMGGTSLKFRGCRYYNLKTGEKDDPRLAYLWVTTAQKKLTYEELKSEMLAIQARILADGWKPARYRDGQSGIEQLKLDLEQAKPNSLGKISSLTFFAKGDVVMKLVADQLYAAKPNVDVKTEANFYHRIELQPRNVWEEDWNGWGITFP